MCQLTDGLSSVEAHLCFSAISDRIRGHVETIPSIYSTSYQDVSTDSLAHLEDAPAPSDGHEFYVLPDGRRFLATVYEKKARQIRWISNATRHADCEPLNRARLTHVTDELRRIWVYDACFREVDWNNKQVTFAWCYLDHIPIAEVTLLGQKLGRTYW